MGFGFRVVRVIDGFLVWFGLGERPVALAGVVVAELSFGCLLVLSFFVEVILAEPLVGKVDTLSVGVVDVSCVDES